MTEKAVFGESGFAPFAPSPSPLPTEAQADAILGDPRSFERATANKPKRAIPQTPEEAAQFERNVRGTYKRQGPAGVYDRRDEKAFSGIRKGKGFCARGSF